MLSFLPLRCHPLWTLCLISCLWIGCGDGSGERPLPDAGGSEQSDARGQTPTTDGAQAASTDAESLADGSEIPLDATIQGTDGQTTPTRDAGTDPEADEGVDAALPLDDPDRNEDGQLNILVIGTNRSIEDRGEAFSPDQIARDLQAILSGDNTLDDTINVVAEDIYRTQVITTGYGQRGDNYDWPYHCHSLAQYFVWPDGREGRLANLLGNGEHDWDHVVIAGDPHIVSTLPGYHALGINQIAQAITNGGAQPHLLMPWPRESSADSITEFAKFTRRISHFSAVDLPLIPAGIAWTGLSAEQRDTAAMHPTPKGAYLAAAAIYSQLLGRSASSSEYTVDDALADAAMTAYTEESQGQADWTPRAFVTAFHAGGISDRVLNFNHTGTSSERGILRGLRWLLDQANVRLDNGGDAPIDFNYGRANTEFEAHKRYRVAPDEFNYSIGFPMQDNSNHGNTSMLYGLDKRRSNDENGTDLGVARKMARDGELPHARAVPIRTLFVRMKEFIPNLSAYADGWHMNHDLDKATGAFMYTMLTGHCALPDEPADQDSNEWRSWIAHKVGYETAWQLMHLTGTAPCFRVLPESADSVSIGANHPAALSISFAKEPRHPVTVTLTTEGGAAVGIDPSELVFTAENYNTPQVVEMSLNGQTPDQTVTLSAQTQSNDIGFNGLTDRWTYSVNR